MSVDIFIQAFENGEPQQIKTAKILACFNGFITVTGDKYIDVVFGPKDSASIYFNHNGDSDTGVMISRPCSDPKLAGCLYNLMKLGNCVLFIPGEEQLIVLNEETITHMPEEMKDIFGETRIADSEQTFTKLFQNL
jgi:hypothetical protein